MNHQTGTDTGREEPYVPRHIILDLLNAVRSVERPDNTWSEDLLRIHVDAATDRIDEYISQKLDALEAALPENRTNFGTRIKGQNFYNAEWLAGWNGAIDACKAAIQAIRGKA